MWTGDGLEIIGIDVVQGVCLGDYQGDWIAVVIRRDFPTRGGFMCVGYGSCSGCDAWEAAESPIERLDLIRDYVRGITWYDTPAAMIEWLQSDHPDLQYFPHQDHDEWLKFKDSVVRRVDHQHWDSVWREMQREKYRQTRIESAPPTNGSYTLNDIRHLEEGLDL